MNKLRMATVWLGGCSGCHMSFLDLDEWLIDLAERVEVVYSPIADVKTYPEAVDVALVEGAIANEEHLHLARLVRARTRLLIAFGDCAVTGNISAIRNATGSAQSVLEHVYLHGNGDGPLPNAPGIVPLLLDRVQPLHAVVAVDAYLPGCPPNARRIRAALEQLLAGGDVRLEGHDMLAFG